VLLPKGYVQEEDELNSLSRVQTKVILQITTIEC